MADLGPEQRQQAVRLYWLAFREKLGRLLGPDDRALDLLDRVARGDHALVALAPDDRVVGVAGFRSPRGGFAVLNRTDLIAVHGGFGGRLRALLLRLLANDIDNDRFLVDGLAVAADWRGRGLGTDLVTALETEARHRGYPAMRLDVADENRRARALYLRLGFIPARHDRLWLLAPVFGMRGSTVMVKPL